MDYTVLATWVAPALSSLGVLTMAYRLRAREAALKAERALIEALRESKLQDHVLDRLRGVEARLELQAEHIAALSSENASLRAEVARLREDNTTLGEDNAQLTYRVSELERELAEERANSSALWAEYQASLGLAKPSHKTDRPSATTTGLKGIKK